MVPQHTRPIAGEDIIMDTLTAYRDAIQFVRDQTIRYMNKGLIFPIYGFQTYFFDKHYFCIGSADLFDSHDFSSHLRSTSG